MEYTFKKRKYGFFVHFVHGISHYADGRKAQSFKETIENFDAEVQR